MKESKYEANSNIELITAKKEPKGFPDQPSSRNSEWFITSKRNKNLYKEEAYSIVTKRKQILERGGQRA